MGFFRKKAEIAKVEIEIPKSPCEIFGHNWRDFPAYVDFTWDSKETSKITIIEPYVCTCCHQRLDKVLLSRSYTGYSEERFYDELEEYKKEYKEIIKPKGIVEDMVQDAIMVDRARLKYWDSLHMPEPQPKEEFEFTLKKNDVEEVY